MENKSNVAKIEYKGKTFSGTYNAAKDSMMTQNHYVKDASRQQKKQSNNFKNSFLYLQNHLLHQSEHIGRTGRD